jgi:hypothetical protein|tara:strand:- start:1439 stop:1843 length:405 start_codon:yes stop_codon:yes gene_type:complete
MNIDEIIEQYTIESSIDTNIDRLNVTEVQEKLVNNKHKWSARLINHKIKLNKYRNQRFTILEEKIEEYQNTQPVMVNKSIAEKAVSKKKDIRVIDNKIENEILIIQHVENIYKNISFATNDIKNLVELMKLEMQ